MRRRRNIKTEYFEGGWEGNATTLWQNSVWLPEFSVKPFYQKAFSDYGLTYHNGVNFKSVGEFAPLLEKYGFRVEFATLFDRPTAQIGENGLENWINMFCAKAFENVDKATKNNIIKNAVELCKPSLYKDGTWYVDYVRLRMKAIKI